MNKKIYAAYAILSIITIAIIINMCCNGILCKLKYSTEVDFISTVSLITTSAITLWIGSSITSKLAIQGSAKQILLNDICKLEDQIYSFEQLSIDREIPLSTAFKAITLISNKIKVIQHSVECFGISNVDFQDLDQSFRKLYMVSTESDSDIVTMHESVDTEILNIQKHIRKIAATINNYN